MLVRLGQLLDECSDNQLLVLGGDFNTDLQPIDRLVGNAVPQHTQAAPRQPDWEQLQHLVQRQDLCALNTFQSWSPTYSGRGPQGEVIRSRIDFMTKRKQADNESRKCRYDHDFILTAHRSNAQHSPMFFSLRAKWTPWKSSLPEIA